MNKLNVFGAGFLAAAIGAVIVGGSVTAATRYGVLPVKKDQGTISRSITRVIPKETAHNRFIVKLPAARSQRGTDVAAFVANAAARVGLYGLRAKADGSKTEFKVTHGRALSVGGTHVVKLSHGITVAEANALTASLTGAGATYAHPDYRLVPQAIPNDEQYGLQWSLNRPAVGIDAEMAWDITTGTDSVVAVMDTGYRPHHDLLDNIIPGYDFLSDPEESRDGDGWDADATDMGDHYGVVSTWHGTHIAGTIGAVGNNGVGLIGIAHGAKVQPVRIIGPYWSFWSDAIDAITWTSGGHVEGVPDNETPATVINFSHTTYTPFGCQNSAFQEAIDAALSRGVSFVAAAGNYAWAAREFTPGSCAGVITVGSSTVEGKRAELYSSWGPDILLSAPGGNGWTIEEPYDHFIWSLSNAAPFEPLPSPKGDNIMAMEGTSQAAAHVSGVVALIQSAAKEAGRAPWTPAEIKTILKLNSGPWTYTPSVAQYQGVGIVNAYRAVLAAQQDLPTEMALSLNLAKGFARTRQYVTARDSNLFKVTVPAGSTSLVVRTYGGDGDVDLYVRPTRIPQVNDGVSKKSVRVGNAETVTFTAPAAGTYYVRAYGRKSAGDFSILATY